MSTVSKPKNDVDPVVNEGAPNVKAEKLFGAEDISMDDKGKVKVDQHVLKTISRPRQPYPQRLKKNRKRENIKSFCLC